MKKRNLFITLGLALGLGIGAAVGLSARQEVKEVKAFSDDTYTLYVNVNNAYSSDKNTKWLSANADTVLRLANSDWSEQSWLRPTSTLETGVYVFDVPVDANYGILCRMNPDRAEDSFDYRWNQTNDITLNSSKNFLNVNWLNGNNCTFDDLGSINLSSYYLLESGEKIYFTLDEYDYAWVDDGATISAYIYNDAMKTKKALTATQVLDTKTYVATLDEDFYAAAFKFVRVAKDKTFEPYKAWENVWNEGENHEFDNSNKTFRGVISRTRTDQWNYADDFRNADATYFAEAFSYYFLEETEGYCSWAGSIDADLANYLKDALDHFETLASGTKAVIYGKTPSHTAAGWRDATYHNKTDVVTEALSRYWNMVKEEGFSDFLGIKANIAARVSGISSINVENNYSTIIIVAISALTLMAFSAFFLLKKKKASK